MIKNINIQTIKENKEIKENFLSAEFKDLKIKCNILNGNFYADSFNYFPISENFQTFDELFTRDSSQSCQHFYSKGFYENFIKKRNNLKNFENIFLLGSNAADNFYSNMLHFLPRLFFNTDNNIKIAIHRNLSNKFRQFIEKINLLRKIKFKFVYLDDDFYSYSNSQIPQFLNLNSSIEILKKFLLPTNEIGDEKIYVTREDSHYRKIVNEFDLITILKSNGYKVINPRLYEIDEQIKIFSQAKKIISTHGSSLTNIIFCKPETEIIEISPHFDDLTSNNLIDRYKKLANINNLKFKQIKVDSIDVSNHSKLAEKYINKKFLDNSNYYKNLIVKVRDFKDFS